MTRKKPPVMETVTPLTGAEVEQLVRVPEMVPRGDGVQVPGANLAMRVRHAADAVLAWYSCVNQKVQSSTGSSDIWL